MTRRNWLAVGAGVVLGLIFLAAGLGKMLNQTESFVIFVFPEFLPAVLDKFILRWLPGVEILLGVLLIAGVAARIIGSLALALTVSLIANNSLLLIQGFGDKPCGCFGMAENWVRYRLSVAGALYIDIIMLALGLLILFLSRGKFLTVSPWFWRRS